MVTIYQQGRYVACVEPSMIVRSFSERCVKMNMTTCICHFSNATFLGILYIMYLQGFQFM